MPLAPEKLQASRILATSINLTWIDTNENTKYYIICLSSTNDVNNNNNNCDNGDILKSVSNSFQINELSANTTYEFKVKAHSIEDYDGPYSDSITIRTHADGKISNFDKILSIIDLFSVPSKVLNLNYEIVNKTAICVYWDAPLRKNGKLTKYLVSYTPNSNWPLDDWFNKSVPITNKKSKVSIVCKIGNNLQVIKHLIVFFFCC